MISRHKGRRILVIEPGALWVQSHYESSFFWGTLYGATYCLKFVTILQYVQFQNVGNVLTPQVCNFQSVQHIVCTFETWHRVLRNCLPNAHVAAVML